MSLYCKIGNRIIRKMLTENFGMKNLKEVLLLEKKASL